MKKNKQAGDKEVKAPTGRHASALLTACLLISTAAAAAPLPCARLVGLAIPASAMDLPTSGAVVDAADVVAASGAGVAKVPEHCLVAGSIAPVDKTAPNIKFKIALPTVWNGKALMFGGGGFNGSVPNVLGNVPAAPTDQPSPIARGYATFGSDSGHQANALASRDHAFGMNDEALRNFGGDALKKTHDAAVFIIKARYGATKKIQRSYFAGGSTGGREALAVITHWPQDWDGAISWYPAWNDLSALLQGQRINRALAQPGAYPNTPKRKLLMDAALAACDGLDGVVDGLIAKQDQCNAVFDPAVLRCVGGADTGDTCLSDAQITALKVMNTDAHFNFALASGETQYPGSNVWGADLGITSIKTPIQPIVTFLALGTAQPARPMPTAGPYIGTFMDQWIKYAVTRDPSYDTLSLDPENPGPWAGRISALSAQLDTPVNLDAFAAKGGKLLLAHGLSDVLVSTRATAQYYQRLQARMKPGELDKFVRYYEVAGYGHALSSTFNAAWDSLTALENWVEKAKAPTQQIVTDTIGVPGRTRPLCDYPQWPKYKGAGDVNLAASFTCSN